MPYFEDSTLIVRHARCVSHFGDALEMGILRLRQQQPQPEKTYAGP